MNRRWRIGLIVAVPVALGALVASILLVTSQTGSAERVIIASGSDRRPNRTAEDWVTYADYVVVVTPIGEREDADNPSEEGDSGPILRDVTLRVDEVLWARPGASVAAPSTFTWKAYGWVYRNDDLSDRVMMAGDDEPRIELGHTYIMAIQWEEARCSPGDPYVPARWRGLGDDSTIPYDGGVIGQGELEGRSQSVAEARQRVQPVNISLEDQLIGQDAGALREALAVAQPGQREQFGPSPDTTKCS